MEVLCRNCSAKLNIPEDKIPKGQKVSVSCPRCHEKIIIDATPSQSGTAPPAKNIPANPLPLSSAEQDESEDAVILETIQGGKSLALVMSNNDRESSLLRTSVEELGYRFVPAETPRKAISLMRFNTFDLVIMPENYQDMPIERNPVLDFLNHLPMSVRRHITLVLFGERLTSNDRMTAFTMSANLAVNSRDLEKLADILITANADHQMLYRVFLDSIEALGKL